jgi:hypothetical protein
MTAATNVPKSHLRSGGVGYRPKHFFQATASAQQGGAAVGGLNAVAGTAAAAFSIDRGAIQGCTAAGGAGSPHQLATDPALVDHKSPVASGAVRDRPVAETPGRRPRCGVAFPVKSVPPGGRDRYIWSEPIARTMARASGRRGS